MITTLMGDKVEGRKEFLAKYANFNKRDAFMDKLEKKDSAVEEEIENKSIVTEAAVQVGVVDTLVQTEEAPAEETADATEEVETTEEN